MQRHIALITYLVRDYDEAIAWFQNALGFKLFENAEMDAGKRWVVMGPDTNTGGRFLLAKAASPEQSSQIGKAAGGRVAFFLSVVGFEAMVPKWAAKGIEVAEPARQESYGTCVVLKDKYGNRWDVLDAATMPLS